MKVKEAIPALFQKAYPVLDPKTEMLLALSLLRFQEIDALPLSFDSGGKSRAVMGSSCLAKLMQIDRRALPKFLKQPCEEASRPIATVRTDVSLRVLLDKFQQTHFGFARVEEKKRVGALVGLWDLLGLYETGHFESDLVIGDVASPIFSLPGETTVKEALRQMFDRKCRRVFVSGTDGFVWDRAIIQRLFSPETLSEAAGDSGLDLLGMPLSEFESVTPVREKAEMSLKDAARVLREGRGKCLVTGGSVVTPWDVVMKPWRARALRTG